MRNLNIIYTIESKESKKMDQSAAIVDINKNEIQILSREYIPDVTKAFVALCYGNSSKIFFSLDSLIEVKKDGPLYLYRFNAPDKNKVEKKNKRMNLKIDGCVGYNKLITMLKPKHQRKEN